MPDSKRASEEWVSFLERICNRSDIPIGYRTYGPINDKDVKKAMDEIDRILDTVSRKKDDEEIKFVYRNQQRGVNNMTWDEYNEARFCRGLLRYEDLDSDELDEESIEEPVNEVEKQNYYFRNGIEVKEVIQTVFQFFGDNIDAWEAASIYNILKYLMRYKFKDNAKQDLEKIHVYVNWLLEAQE